MGQEKMFQQVLHQKDIKKASFITTSHIPYFILMFISLVISYYLPAVWYKCEVVDICRLVCTPGAVLQLLSSVLKKCQF